ncbi:heat-inducible transcription repressor HrcA [bacterium]|nr:heat-inducible transcription repressor HrcA [bacterium]
MHKLNNRQKDILRCIIQQYIETAYPVGSKHLVKTYRLNSSSATIRNEMANLEEMGYLNQPHISAGRTPTEKAYRFYVNSLMSSEGLSTDERRAVKETIKSSGSSMSSILDETSKILGKISEELSVVLTPWLSWGVFDHLELINLTAGKILAVIHVKSRLVKTVVLEVDSKLNDEDLIKASSVLNERLSSLTLEEIRNTIKERVRDAKPCCRVVIEKISGHAEELFDFSEPMEVHYSGTRNILKQPEFSSINTIEPLLSLIDDKSRLVRIFNRKVRDVEVTIGNENEKMDLKSFAVVAASYRRGRDVGTLGVVGPIRMRYDKIVPLVNYVAKTMSQSFC